MRCPFCHHRDSRVTDSRASDDGIRRRRECVSCGERYSTVETVQLATLQIVKRDGRREDFSREKLFTGLRRACTKLPVSMAELDAIVDDIQNRITADGRAEVSSSVVGELAMDALRPLDHIAYIRFASVYRSFSDIATLKEAVEALEHGHVQSAESRSLQLSLLERAGGEEPRPLGDGAEPGPAGGRAARNGKAERMTGTI
ncbi:MAG: transcriptional regulator NrdR [Dehalococcoidia bacterium]|nr:transcriptional regulator NrdR [Dehalococcoidia bacterium]